ncbi:MAG: NAD(P)-dependent oxidoreductase [Actinomycetota bacterium]
MTDRSTVVGFVGLGAMGSRMAAGLLEAGYPLVVYNRSPERAAAFDSSSAEVVATPAQVAERAEIVCGCLLDGDAIEQVYGGPDGLISRSRRGQVYVEHGTFAPDLARDVAARLGARGATFLDAPVTGGPDAASSGNLTMMIGGPAEALPKVLDVLGSYAARIRYIGDSGAGLELKLVNQLLVSCHVAAAAEAIAILRQLRLPLDVASEVLNAGWAASAMLDRSLTRHRNELSEESDVTIGGLVEPQRLAAQLAAGLGLDLTLLPTVAKLFADASMDGMAKKDLAALVRMFQNEQ